MSRIFPGFNSNKWFTIHEERRSTDGENITAEDIAAAKKRFMTNGGKITKLGGFEKVKEYRQHTSPNAGHSSVVRNIKDGTTPEFHDEILYSAREIAKKCGLKNTRNLYEMRRSGLLPDPDVGGGRFYWCGEKARFIAHLTRKYGKVDDNGFVHVTVSFSESVKSRNRQILRQEWSELEIDN